MKLVFNDKLLFLTLAILQPASAKDSLTLLTSLFKNSHHLPTQSDADLLFRKWESKHLIIPVHKGRGFYSLTHAGHHFLPEDLRKFRDRTRIELIKNAYHASVKTSEGVARGLDDASSSAEPRTTTKEASRPVVSGRDPSQTRLIRLPARNYWPRFSEQLNLRVGLDSPPSDSQSGFRPFRYCSFPTLKSIRRASSIEPDSDTPKDLNSKQLALCIGVSPALISLMRRRKKSYYRTFKIGKKSGGERTIESPRVFLKSIQYWIKTYFFHYLTVHDACHAYLKDRSIISNAKPHVGKKYVANLDIENFFGNITENDVKRTLIRNGLGPTLSSVIADFLTLDNHLPQGAPTSPSISNAYLFEFDLELTNFANVRNLNYSRYADDLSISGNSIEDISMCIKEASSLLKRYGLTINNGKTRIANRNSSQRVTGVVVNEKLQPPRPFRRKVRAMFHRASLNPDEYSERHEELKGYYSYLSSYDSLADGNELTKYKNILDKLYSVTGGKK